jgi:hypothetical protein
MSAQSNDTRSHRPIIRAIGRPYKALLVALLTFKGMDNLSGRCVVPGNQEPPTIHLCMIRSCASSHFTRQPHEAVKGTKAASPKINKLSCHSLDLEIAHSSPLSTVPDEMVQKRFTVPKRVVGLGILGCMFPYNVSQT